MKDSQERQPERAQLFYKEWQLFVEDQQMNAEVVYGGTPLKSPCEGRNLQEIVCLAEVDLSPKPFFNPIWAVTLFIGPMNVIMDYESH